MAKISKKISTAKSVVPALAPLKGEDKGAKTEAHAIIKDIDRISTSVDSLHEDVALTGAKIVIHAVKHGDVTLADRLINALDKSKKGKTLMRGNVMRAWFEQFGPFRYDTESKAFKLNSKKRDELKPRVKNADAIKKFASELRKAKAWELKPEKKYVPYDFLADMEAKLKQAERMIAKSKDDPKSNVIGFAEVKAGLERAKAERIKAEAEALSKVEAVANA